MRIFRLALGTFLPPFFGAVVLLAILVIERGSANIPAIAGSLVFSLILSYCIMILPSLVYSILMEVVGIFLKKRIIPYLFLSAVLGIGATWVRFHPMSPGDLNYILPAGVLTGILTGLILKRLHTVEANLYIWQGTKQKNGSNV
jgi:hypothetical protein